MARDSGAVTYCPCGAALDDNGLCSAPSCFASVPDTHLGNPAWPLGTSLCGRARGRGGERLHFVTARPTGKKCASLVSRRRKRNRHA